MNQRDPYTCCCAADYHKGNGLNALNALFLHYQAQKLIRAINCKGTLTRGFCYP